MHGLFDVEDDLDILFKEMKGSKFDPMSISRVTHELLIQEKAPLGSLKKRTDELH